MSSESADRPAQTPVSFWECGSRSHVQSDGRCSSYVLLALAIVISLLGIVTTLVLSIHERTRELGMLRAVGMSRRQVHRLVRYEAVITALCVPATGL